MLRGRVFTSSSMRAVGIAALCATLLAACGSSHTETLTYTNAKAAPAPDHQLWIYSSLPQRGPQRAETQQIQDGIELELWLVHHHQGQYTFRYRPLNDANAHGWVASRVVRNAQLAARNPHTIAYIGDLDSGATMLSLPILNQAGIVQITPGSPYPGLTDALPASTDVTVPGEPDKYYPQHNRTLLRQIPNDVVQAAAAIEQLRSLGCSHVSAVSFGGGTDGPALQRAVADTAALYGMTYVTPTTALGTDTAKYSSWAAGLRDKGAGCFVLTGRVTPDAIALTKELHVQLPSAPILGTYGLCNSKWTSPSHGGIPTDADPRLFCTSPVFPLRTYPARAFIGDFHNLFNRNPGPYALYGYLAAEMLVATVDNLTTAVDSRSELLGLLIEGRSEYSAVIGHYTFDAAGNIHSHRYALYSVVDGHPKYSKALTPQYLLPQHVHYGGS